MNQIPENGSAGVRTLRKPACLALLCLLVLLAGCTGIRAGGSSRDPAASVEEIGPAAAYLAGRFSLDQGDYRSALRFFRRALEADPENLELRRRVFILEVATGDFERAVRSARELRDLSPRFAEARLTLAIDALRRDDWQAARAQLEAIDSRGVLGIVQPLLLAWTDFAIGRREAALDHVRAEGRKDGMKLLAAYHEGMMLAFAGRLKEAADRFEKAIGEDGALPVRLVQGYAYVLERLGKNDRALALVRRQLDYSPEETALRVLEQRIAGRAGIEPPFHDPRSAIADALFGVGQALSTQNLGERSLVFTRFATFTNPELAEAWLLIAQLALRRQQPEEAVEALRNIPKSAPISWETRLIKADALIAAGRKDEAVRLLRRMAAERPDRIDALVALGDFFRRERNYVEAEKAYAEAIRRIDRPTRAHWRLFYVHGITLERTKRWPEAERELLKALELQPDQPFVLNYLGYSWVDQGLHLDRAKQMLHRAVELRPRDGFIVDSLGWAYYRLGEYDRAVRYLERAVELEPGDPVINDHLGDAYWRVGRKREARFQWRRALTLKPEKDLVPKIRRKLRAGLDPADTGRG